MDKDLEEMSYAELLAKAKEMREAIRAHRDATGHNLCWWVPELWNLLPDKKVPDPEIPPEGEFLACCATYRKSLGK